MSENGDTLVHLEARTVAAYMDGGLSPSDAAAVETHLAECATCRAEVVQLEAVVRPRRGRRRIYLVAFAAAAAALVLIALPRDIRSPSDTGSAVDVEATALRELGNLAQAPIYLGVSVRAGPEQGTQQFVAGMRAYTVARYADAITGLRGARSAGVTGPAATFFLAASQLMLGDAEGAETEFARVIAMGETSYLGEAHYYRAKALLRLGQASDAVSELEQSARTENEAIRAIAQSLRDSVRLLRAR